MADVMAEIGSTPTTGDVSLWGQLNEVSFIHAYLASISMIIVSELGDKTFFIAAIMAMRHARSTVFMGAISAIFVMNTLAVILGLATSVIPNFITHYGSILLFAVFGVKLLYDGFQMTDDEGKEEYEEVQKVIKEKESLQVGYETLKQQEDPETGIIPSNFTKVDFSTKVRRRMMAYVSLIFIETFTMTFLAEWGDRSQIATIVLAAREDVWGVAVGALCGHIICTGIAVLGGRFIAQLISVKTVTIIGGFVFLFFSVFSYLGGSE